MLPSAQQIDGRLAQILRRGSLTAGPSASVARIMVVLTRACELRCSYCLVNVTSTDQQAEHSGSADPAWQQGLAPEGDMAASTLKQAIDRLMTSQLPRLGIQWFGGEPLRCWDTLLQGVHWALDHPLRGGRDIRMLLTTNGILLDSARLVALEGLPITVQLSLDGDAHGSRFRHGPSDPPSTSFDRILAAVDELNDTDLAWFMNATIPPSAAQEVMNRYLRARGAGVPALQLN